MVRMLGVAAVLVLLGRGALAGPAETYPDGYSAQTFEERKFELLVPDGFGKERIHAVAYTVTARPLAD